jgi:PTS system, fructose subfamily, IIC component
MSTENKNVQSDAPLKLFGRTVKTAALTGVSYMIPFVVAGGILIALGFAFGGIYVYETTGFAADMFAWGKMGMSLMVYALGGYVAYSIADRPGIAVGFITGFMADALGSGFLGALLGGIIAGYLVLLLKKIPMPRILKPMMPVLIIPFFGVLIMGIIMYYVLGGPIAWLNTAMTSALSNISGGALILLGILQGAMACFDLGGPVNKAAYAFALAASATGNWTPLAACFIASMAPPFAMALAMLIAKKKYTDAEKGNIGPCLVGGLTMITEFAIPFAAANPLRVLPAFMAGGALGSALAYAFGLSMQAPHGGLFVIALCNKPLLFLLVLAISVVATALLLVVLRKPPSEQDKQLEGFEV